MEAEASEYRYPPMKKRVRPSSPKANSSEIEISNVFSALEVSQAVKKQAVEKITDTQKCTSSTTGTRPRVQRSISCDRTSKADVPAHTQGFQKKPETETTHRSLQGSGSGGLRKKVLSKDNLIKVEDRSPQSKDKAGKSSF